MSYRTLSPIHKLSILFAGLGIIIIIIAYIVISPADDAAAPITEHSFSHGSITWSIDQYPAIALHENTFTLFVTDQQGAPLQSAKLSVKLDMLGMICGDTSFDLTEISPGTYIGEGVPLMAGNWAATLTLVIDKESFTITRHLKAIHAAALP